MNVAPAGFSLPDRYGKYRRMMKRRLDQLKNEGH
jgi:rRNA maturation protein Nop10